MGLQLYRGAPILAYPYIGVRLYWGVPLQGVPTWGHSYIGVYLERRTPILCIGGCPENNDSAPHHMGGLVAGE